jgi:hypothetical protein
MSNKKILFQKLDDILGKMVGYSFTLGDWGKHIGVEIYLRDNGYDSSSFSIEQSEIERFESQKSCNSCRKYIYFSKYEYTTDIYSINFNLGIKELWENMLEVESKIIDIETLAIGIRNIVVNSHLDPSKEYRKILIYFERNILDYNRIIEEIKESIIFGQSIPENYKSTDKLVFTFTALKEKKKGTNDDETDLSYPDYYKFGFRIYES